MSFLAPAKPAVTEMIADVMAKHHGELVDAGVTVGALFAHPGENEDSAVRLNGYPCAAVVKKTSYRLRVQGIADAVITFDAAVWAKLSEAERVALIDHELTHLELVKDKDFNLKSDDCGRPLLKMRLHDWQLGGFAVIAHRHGPAALETQGFRAAYEAYYQQVFAWSDDSALDLPEGTTLSMNGKPIASRGELDSIVGEMVERVRAN